MHSVDSISVGEDALSDMLERYLRSCCDPSSSLAKIEKIAVLSLDTGLTMVFCEGYIRCFQIPRGGLKRYRENNLSNEEFVLFAKKSVARMVKETSLAQYLVPLSKRGSDLISQPTWKYRSLLTNYSIRRILSLPLLDAAVVICARGYSPPLSRIVQVTQEIFIRATFYHSLDLLLHYYFSNIHSYVFIEGCREDIDHLRIPSPILRCFHAFYRANPLAFLEYLSLLPEDQRFFVRSLVF